jgi:hypothetical protein
MVVQTSVFFVEPAAPDGIMIIANAAKTTSTPIAAPPRKTGFLLRGLCVRYQRLISSLPLTVHHVLQEFCTQQVHSLPRPTYADALSCFLRGRRGDAVV